MSARLRVVAVPDRHLMHTLQGGFRGVRTVTVRGGSTRRFDRGRRRPLGRVSLPRQHVGQPGLNDRLLTSHRLLAFVLSEANYLDVFTHNPLVLPHICKNSLG